MSEKIIRLCITNLGLYLEDTRYGFLSLPTNQETVQALLAQIRVDGRYYGEIEITDVESRISGLAKCIGAWDSIDALNYLAALINEMDDGELEKFEAAIAYGEYTGSIQDLINLTQNLDCFEYLPGVKDDEDLGRYMVDELDALQVPEHIKPYLDYEYYGRDVRLEDGGNFTDRGYVASTRDSFIEHYNGRDIPEEYRVFAYPTKEAKHSIMETLRQYRASSPPEQDGGERPAACVER